MSSLSVKITSKKTATGEVWEGTATVSSRVKPTKLQKQDGCTHFSTKAGVTQTAQKLATELNLTLKLEEPKVATATPVKKAAKKSATKTKKKTTTGCTYSTPSW